MTADASGPDPAGDPAADPTGGAAVDPRPARFDVPYLLVTNIPIYEDPDGSTYLHRLWYRDFVAHLDYLPNLRCAAPLRARPKDRTDMIPLDPSLFPRSRIVPIPAARSVAGALLRLPATVTRLWRAVGEARVVHYGIVGWPYPYGWIAAAAARLRRRATVVVVESATWRIPPTENAPSRLARLRAAVSEFLARRCCRSTDLCIYTHPSYLEQLHVGARGAAVVAPATWIDDTDVLEPGTAEARWSEKLRGPVRFLFPAKMIHEKGVRVLLDALRILDGRQTDVRVDAIGSGPLLAEVRATAASLHHVRLGVLDPVPYGPAFFGLLDSVHAVLAPSLSDEQPRIFFDAAARAVPLLASATDGLRFLIEDEVNGRLVPPGDAAALAAGIAGILADPRLLRDLGLRALPAARQATHGRMHADRSRLLVRHLAGVAEPGPAGGGTGATYVEGSSR